MEKDFDKVKSERFKGTLAEVVKELKLHIEYVSALECDKSVGENFQKIISLLPSLKAVIQQYETGKMKENYLNHFQSDLDYLLSSLLFLKGYQESSFINSYNNRIREEYKHMFDQNSTSVLETHDKIEFKLYFFSKIDYFDKNIVAVGANGSGKTRLSNHFKVYLEGNGVVISAERIMLIPYFDSIANPTTTADALNELQMIDKSSKSNHSFRNLEREFGVVLNNMLAENVTAGHKYRKEADIDAKSGKTITAPEPTNLDIALAIWNSLIEHRTIGCDDGLNITANFDDGNSYPAVEMSDGEKVMLYLIAQVLQAPRDGFIIVDEPEMYLHKTIVTKLWDSLEAQRSDCIFIYLTHDLDFATSRTTAKKLWIKSFTYPNKWEIENIISDNIPEPLLLELLGSRKNILFCEGEEGSLDERIFNILFPQFTVTPVKSCFDVMNHTKAFNKLKNVTTEAIGIIDSDYHPRERLAEFREDKIYTFSVAEIENLLLDEEFLKLFAARICSTKFNIDDFKNNLIKHMETMKDLQASNYVSARIDYYFKDSNISKGNTLIKLNKNYADFLTKVSIEDWYKERVAELEKMIEDSDYKKVIQSFNNKGLKGKANSHLGIDDFYDRAIAFLQSNEAAKQALLKYFPDVISHDGDVEHE